MKLFNEDGSPKDWIAAVDFLAKEQEKDGKSVFDDGSDNISDSFYINSFISISTADNLLREAAICLQEVVQWCPPTHSQWAAELANRLRAREQMEATEDD